MIKLILAILLSYGTPGVDDQTGCVQLLTEYISVSSTTVDSGGSWTIVSVPNGSSLTNADLAGSDNPCVDLDQCGVYILRYRVTSTTCAGCFDEEDVPFEKCCLSITTNCAIN